MSKNEFNQAPIAIAVPHSVNPINGNEKVLLVNGQAMVVVGQVLASSPVEAESQDHLLPYREEKKWHYDLCDRYDTPGYSPHDNIFLVFFVCLKYLS